MTRTQILRARMARLDRIAETLTTEIEKVRVGELWWICCCEIDNIELNEIFKVDSNAKKETQT